nr:unnamed protein product [Callosobruchus chinensis]
MSKLSYADYGLDILT